MTAVALPPRPMVWPRPTLASFTWRGPAWPRSCQTSSQTSQMPMAGVASPQEREPPLGVVGGGARGEGGDALGHAVAELGGGEDAGRHPDGVSGAFPRLLGGAEDGG